MPISYTALPQFRDPGPLDFSPLHSALDDWAKSREKNRLLEEAKELGASLQPAQGQAPASYTAQPVNRLLSPAQGAAAAAGRDYLPGPNATLDFIKQQEGYAPTAAWDRRQYSSGYGTKAAPGETITRDVAETRLRDSISPINDWISRNITVPLTDQQRAGLTSFAYNLGVDDLQKLLPDINAGAWDRVAARMPSFNKALGANGQLETVGGLTDRRNREAALVSGGGAPAATPARPGLNYAAGIQTALRQGNLSAAMQLQNAQQEADNTAYTRGRQATQDAQAAETHELSTQQARETLQKNFTSRVGAIAQTIQSEPDPAKRQAMWQRFIAADPRFTQALRAYGVDPSDVEAGTRTLIAEARGLTGGEETGTTVQYFEDPVTKELKPWVVTKKGDFRAVNVPGRILPTPKTVDQGTSTAIIGPGGQPLAPALPKDVAGKERQQEIGKAQGQAQVDLPRVQSNSDAMIAQVDALLNDPYLATMTGPVQGRLPNLSGDSQRVLSKVEQLNGQAFLQAFASLKGGGQITEIEGAKATAALSRLQNMKVNDADYPAALNDFKNEIVRLRQLAEQKASGAGGAPAGGNAESPPVAGARRAPDGHWYVEQNGQFFRVDR